MLRCVVAHMATLLFVIGLCLGGVLCDSGNSGPRCYPEACASAAAAVNNTCMASTPRGSNEIPTFLVQGAMYSFCFFDCAVGMIKFTKEIGQLLAGFHDSRAAVPAPTTGWSVARYVLNVTEGIASLLPPLKDALTACKAEEWVVRLVKVWVKFASWANDLQLAAHFFIKRYEANALMFDILKAWGAQNWCGMGFFLGLLFQLVVNEKWSCPIHAMVEQRGSTVHSALPSPSLPPTNVCLANITQAIAASHVRREDARALVPLASAYDNSSTGCSPVPWISCTGSCCTNLYGSSCCPESCVSTRVGAVCCSRIGMVSAPSGTYCCPPNTIPCSEPPEGYPAGIGQCCSGGQICCRSGRKRGGSHCDYSCH